MELNKPNPFTPDKNHIGRDWQIWKKEFLIYLRLSGGYERYTEERRSLLLLNLMGTKAIKAMDKMTLIDKENDMDTLLMKFDEIFDPPANELEERYKFFSRRKNDKESIDTYIIDLKDKASKCNFGRQTDKFIIDMIIRNMDFCLRSIIFSIDTEDLSIPDIVQRYKQYTSSNEKIQQLSRDITKSMISENSENNQNSNQNSSRRAQSENYRKSGVENAQTSNPASSAVNEQLKSKPVCSKCGMNHPYKQCPAYDVICPNCSTKGHYGSKCKETKSDGNNSTTKQNRSSNTLANHSTSKPSNTPNIQVNKQNEASNNPINNVNTPQKSQNETQRLFETRIEDCLWCESKHAEGQCRHDANCRRCNSYPHNICFQCKKNPHDIECRYKMVLTLPSKVNNTTTNNSNTKNSNTMNPNNSDLEKCLQCGIRHLPHYCCMCKLYGHKTTTCYMNERQQNASGCSTTSDPLLNTYVNVDHASSCSIS